jgi:hypothetical protein
MLDFRTRQQSRNYLSRREQRRLFAWVMGIGLVTIACSSFIEFGAVWSGDLALGTSTDVTVDTRFKPRDTSARESDAITIVNAEQQDNIADDDQRFAGIDPELLALVRDDTPWIRSDEVDAWLNVWSALRQANDAMLTHGSPVGFLELFQQPRAFRGKSVTIRGSARQAVYVTAADNPQGIEGYYRVVVRPEKGPDEPIFLYTLELPGDFPRGEEIGATITASGVFFKRMVYPAKDNETLRRAPVVMARTLSWQRPAVPDDAAGDYFAGVMAALVALGAVGLVAATYWASQIHFSARPPRPPTLPNIDEGDVLSTEESLRKLAESD